MSSFPGGLFDFRNFITGCLRSYQLPNERRHSQRMSQAHSIPGSDQRQLLERLGPVNLIARDYIHAGHTRKARTKW